MDVLSILRSNVNRVEARIADACTRAGRPRAAVTLVGITKYVDVPTTRLLATCGIRMLGESRPQTLWEKAPLIPEVEWHLVGHLQRNKVARTLPLAKLIHSVDSERLLQTLEVEAARLNRFQDVLLEIQLSGEANKHGFDRVILPRLPELVSGLRHVRIRGLMCMAALDSTQDDAHRTFAALRELRDQWQPCLPEPHQLTELSMGMTHDCEAAILEGATLVRIGSALFEGLLGE